VILSTPYLFLEDYLRHLSFQSTDVCSALEASGVDALYKFTFYLLTYLLSHVDILVKSEFSVCDCNLLNHSSQQFIIGLKIIR